MIVYKVDQGAIFDLFVDDFAAACKAATGGTLDRIEFTVIPSWNQCYLCYHLVTPPPQKLCNYEVVDAGANPNGVRTFYVNENVLEQYISDLTYVTVESFVGTSLLTYTGYDTDGASYTGTVKIVVGTPDANPIRYTIYKEAELSFKSADFQNTCLNTTGEELASIAKINPTSYITRCIQAALHAVSKGAWANVSRLNDQNY